jgi:hypothetical protein
MAKSKFFRAFVEGNTISDGRVVTAQMIDQVVETFNADTYTPRCNVEHIKGYSPEPPFNGYGDVTAVRAQTDDIVIDGKTAKRRALYCQVDGNDQLTKLAAADQKPFPSVELTDSYAGTGKVGLIGLAFTDSPASIATQKLQFSRSAPGTTRLHGDEAIALEFEPDLGAAGDVTKVESAITGFFSALTAKFKGDAPAVVPPAPAPAPAPAQTPANDNFAAFAEAMGSTVAQSIAASVKPIADAQAQFRTDFDALKAQIEKTVAPDQFNRPPANGGNGAVVTDC